MRGILRTGLIGFVVLGSVTVADEARATPGAGVAARTVGQRAVHGAGPARHEWAAAPGGTVSTRER
ncbi:hypothetical protein [Actinoplanes teichomyceticus]|uniref:Uncharacterized protein n=1 Tax=Actinoplanes teichomyceticus TaxID=1867 RepID=A0A561WJX5_ACTTI|nr:hypothetical protein [Actinoplanes teichomyceticus]TWG24133.1 hypothetical protein FHX34_102686 [Actinoplanes teichomyceticus]GIF13020.1 hypothetical protein Ate01nite_30520 [Actinoplanes teichomyceticus]